MLTHPPRTGAAPAASTSTARRSRSHLPRTATSTRTVPEVALIPGNRFVLLPLRKVTAFVRPHTPCGEPSATTTKPCIVAKPKPAEIQRQSRGLLLQEFHARAAQAHSRSSRGIAKPRRRRSVAVAKTRLSPVREQAASGGVEQPELLLEYESLLAETRNCSSAAGVPSRFRAKDTSVFTLGETTTTTREPCRGDSPGAPSSTQMQQELNLNTATKKKKKKKRSSSFSNVSDVDLVLYKSSTKTHRESRSRVSTSTERVCVASGGRSFGRNNRVSPSSLSHGQQMHPEFGTGNELTTSFGKADDLQTPKKKNRSNSRAPSFGKADELVTPRDKNYRSKARSNFTTSSKADELVPELEMPWNQDRSNCRDKYPASFSKVDELVALCDKHRSHFRDNNSTTSFEKGDELEKLCDKNNRKKSSRGYRRASFGKAEELLTREKKRRAFSFWGCSYQIRSSSPFLCSFTNKDDLPVGPSPVLLYRRLQNKASV